MIKKSIPGLLIAFLLLCTFLCLGDTIYLKNGQKIRTSYAEIKGDKVSFSQFGGIVSLPMSLVDRIESDRFIEPEKGSALAPSSASTPTTPETSTTAEQQPAQEGKQPPAQESKESDPEQEKKDPEYWIKKKQELTQRLAQAEKELQEAKHDNFATRYAGGALERSIKRIESLENEIARLKLETANLETEAKKYGILPGVFRE